MLKNRLFLSVTLIVPFTQTAAFAISSTCVQPDWKPFCDRPEAPGTRCVLTDAGSASRDFCDNTTVGCAEVGGCFGDVPPGSWYPISEGNVSYKCRCGCVAADKTFFLSGDKKVLGREFIDSGKKEGFIVGTIDSLETPWQQSDREVNGLTFSKSKEEVLEIKTSRGRDVIVSLGHPVLIANENGTPQEMKRAETVETGDYVLGDDGFSDEIISITKLAYSEHMMNFNVKSKNAAHHILPNNGILLGDSAWQERLNAREARVLLRAELASKLMKEGETK